MTQLCWLVPWLTSVDKTCLQWSKSHKLLMTSCGCHRSCIITSPPSLHITITPGLPSLYHIAIHWFISFTSHCHIVIHVTFTPYVIRHASQVHSYTALFSMQSHWVMQLIHIAQCWQSTVQLVSVIVWSYISQSSSLSRVASLSVTRPHESLPGLQSLQSVTAFSDHCNSYHHGTMAHMPFKCYSW